MNKMLFGLLAAVLLVTPAFAKSSTQALPDLTVRNLKADYDGKYVNVELDVLNKGKEYAKSYSLKVSVFDEDGVRVSEMGVSCAYPDPKAQSTCFLKPGESRHSGFGFAAYGLKPGKYKFVAVVDETNQVWESNENNNEMEKHFIVK